MIIIKGKKAEAKVMIDSIEEECTKQIIEFTNHIAFNKNIVIMPDTHSGKGAVIGFTMPAETKVIPNVIGVDIGCGMCSVPTGISMCKEDLEKINEEIIRKVPTGFNLITGDISKDFDFKKVERKTNKLLNIMGFEKYKLEMDYIEKLMKKLGTNEDTVFKSLGTLGGGNHFIEIGNNGEEDFLTIHTGSRNLGKKVCEYHQRAANTKVLKKKYEDKLRILKENYSGKELGEKIQALKEESQIGVKRELEYLENELARDYIIDMVFCQEFAKENRRRIVEKIFSILEDYGGKKGEYIESVHNYIDESDGIIRKGAIRAYKNEKSIIPFNMRDGILICEGKSNEKWNYSAPHGAGRILSRSMAKKVLKLKEFRNQMSGIVSTCVNEATLDESPMAYKDSKLIEELIQPTVDIVWKLLPKLNIKNTQEIEYKKRV